MFEPWPFACESLSSCSHAAVVWSRGDELNLTLVVKATFEIVAGGDARLVEAAPIAARDRHYDKSSERSVELASELAPQLPGAVISVTGHAHPPRPGATGASIQAALWRDRTIWQKRAHVHGDVTPTSPERSPFERMPVEYERAVADQELNPVGRSRRAEANLIDPDDPSRPIGFGPIGWSWPVRRRRLAAADRRDLLQNPPRFPVDFDFGFFVPVPEDQCIGALAGDEWITLEGWSGSHAQLATRLPGARASARVVMSTATGPTPLVELPLRADTLLIDADRQLVSLIWRGHRPLAIGLESLAHVGGFVALELGEPVRWPEGTGALALTPSPDPLLRPESPIFGASALPPAVSLSFAEALVQAARLSSSASDTAPESPSDLGQTVATTGDDLARATPFVATAARPRKAVAHSHARSPASDHVLPFRAAEENPDVFARLRRKGADIPWISNGHFDVATRSWRLEPGKSSLIVIVKGSYEIAVDGPSLPCGMSEFVSGERTVGDDPEASAIYPDDSAVFKPRADVILIGHAHAPQRSAPVSRVRFRFGRRGNRFDLAINVHGDRVWRKGLVTSAGDAQPFATMPLTYERAHGGPGFAANPHGRGHGESLLMPNLEWPDRPITTPTDRASPACFAPMTMAHPERSSRLGTYDRAWFKERWPHFPADFDWEFFQAAPREQQLAHLVGDEPFDLAGVHPEVAVIRGRLPGDTARAFAIERDDGGAPRLHEVRLRLDTVTFDTDAMKVHLVWRGMYPVRADHAPEVRALFALRELSGAAPIGGDEVTSALFRALAEAEAAREEEPEPPAAPPIAAEPRQADEALRRLEEVTSRMEQDLAEALAKAGVGPEAEDAKADPEALAATLRAAGATEAEIAVVLEGLAPATHPEAIPEVEPLEMRARVIAMLEAGESFEGFDFEGGDLSALDFCGRSLAGADLQRVRLVGARLEGASLVEAQLGEANLEGAALDAADLDGADLTGANLERASLKGASLAGAELSDVNGREADFRQARGDGAFFTAGDWSGARFDGACLAGADFTGARLEATSFVGADLARITLRDAEGPGARFEGATMTAARADGCKLHRASFARVEASGSVFERAELLEADFAEARLAGSSFVGASCLKASFRAANLVDCQLMRAELTGSSFRRANLMSSILDAAQLKIADLRDANLFATSFVDAELTDAKLGGAIIYKSSLVMKRS